MSQTQDECGTHRNKTINSRYPHIKTYHPYAADKDQVNSMIIEPRNKLFLNGKTIDNRPVNTRFDTVKDVLDLPLYNNTKSRVVKDTLKYMFNHMFTGVYVAIKDNKVKMFVPFANMHYRNNWSRMITFENNMNIKQFSKTVKYSMFYDIKRWNANNCLLGNWRDRSGFSSVGDSGRVIIMEWVLKQTCKKFAISDCEFFLNRRDNPMLTRDGSEAYFEIFGNNVPMKNRYNQYTPILSTCSSPDFADIMFPTEDDVLMATNKYFPNQCKNSYIEEFDIQWNDRKNIAVFRGSGTGCGTTIEDNQRLKLAHLSKQWEQDKPGLLDAGLSSWNNREKIRPGQPMKILNPEDMPFNLANKMNREEQMRYKYMIYVDGHVAAYRMAWMLKIGAVILFIESANNYQLWYFEKLVPWVHYVPVDKDLNNLEERIRWCQDKDEECKVMANNAKKFYLEYLTMDGILSYMEQVLNSLAQKQKSQ